MWAGVEVFRAGDRLVGVEYDGDEVRDALRARCREWSADDGTAAGVDVPAAFGVRIAKVGFRRRKVGVVHHGAPVRYRLGSPAEAVDVVARILADIARERAPATVVVDARCFVRDERAVLVDVPLSRDVDERPLRTAGIEEVPAWKHVVDPVARTVEVRGETWPLAGIAVVGHPPTGLDPARQRAWSLGEGDVLAWAELIDGLGEELVHGIDDVLDACERVLR